MEGRITQQIIVKIGKREEKWSIQSRKIYVEVEYKH